jgi:hypothetical protein
MTLATIWTHHLPEEDRADLEASIRGSRIALERLWTILSEEEQKHLTQLSVPNFTEPAWAEHVAHRLGDLYRIRKLQDLLCPIIKG